MGYRFDVLPLWAAPRAPIESQQELSIRRTSTTLGDDVPIETVLTDRSGKECGTHTIRFAFIKDYKPDPKASFEGLGPRYFVDNADLADLLHLISVCAAQ